MNRETLHFRLSLIWLGALVIGAGCLFYSLGAFGQQ
jgi:hypothetical protein